MTEAFSRDAFGATKKDPALYDNFTKVVGSHTVKAGFYWDTSENFQSSWRAWAETITALTIWDGAREQFGKRRCRLPPRTQLGNYQQMSSFPTIDLKFHQWSIYAQDSFKASRQLTLNYGLRFDHVGQCTDRRNGLPGLGPSDLSAKCLRAHWTCNCRSE